MGSSTDGVGADGPRGATGGRARPEKRHGWGAGPAGVRAAWPGEGPAGARRAGGAGARAAWVHGRAGGAGSRARGRADGAEAGRAGSTVAGRRGAGWRWRGLPGSDCPAGQKPGVRGFAECRIREALGKDFFFVFNFFAECPRSGTRQRFFFYFFLNSLPSVSDLALGKENFFIFKNTLPSAPWTALGKDLNFFF